MKENSENLWSAYTDGASRGNPGLAGCGAIIISPQGQEHTYKKFIGTQTNNQAEYKAMIMALEALVELGAQNVILRADSEFMIKQMNGEYRVKNSGILPLFQRASGLLQNFSQIKFEHVRRENNKIADKLANEAIDESQEEQF